LRYLDASAEPGDDRVCGDGDPVVSADESDRQEPGDVYVMGGALLIGGIVMWIIDAMKAPWEAAGPGANGTPIHTWKMDDIHGGQAVWIGACQILSALFPGTSRSMSTIAGGALAGCRAGRIWSFVLSPSFHPEMRCPRCTRC